MGHLQGLGSNGLSNIEKAVLRHFKAMESTGEWQHVDEVSRQIKALFSALRKADPDLPIHMLHHEIVALADGFHGCAMDEYERSGGFASALAYSGAAQCFGDAAERLGISQNRLKAINRIFGDFARDSHTVGGHFVPGGADPAGDVLICDKLDREGPYSNMSTIHGNTPRAASAGSTRDSIFSQRWRERLQTPPIGASRSEKHGSVKREGWTVLAGTREDIPRG